MVKLRQILIFIIIILPIISSAKTQSSTEWKRKLNHLNSIHNETLLSDLSTLDKTHNHRNHHKHNSTHIKGGKKRPHSTSSTGRWKQEQHLDDGLTAWSTWSKCSKKCRQSRQRKCIIPSSDSQSAADDGRSSSPATCAGKELRQERPCRKGRCKQRGATGGSGNKAFHVVLPPKKESLKNPTVTSSSSNSNNNQQQSDVRVLLSLNSIFYSSWSRWSSCSKACTTTRFRTCRFQVVCGNTVLHEEAYCYTEGTDCEKWYSGRSRHHHKEDDRYEQNSKEIVPELPDRVQHKKTSKNNNNNNNREQPMTEAPKSLEYDGQPECGVPAISGGSSGNPSYSLQLRIIGGREAAPGKWPWQVAILNRFKEAFCGGTLIGSRWVLTAAHCLRKRLYVRIGEYDLVEDDGTEIDFRVEEVFVHPDYDPETVDNDVALLRLPEAIRLGEGTSGVGNARLACLPQPGQSLPITQKCTIIGWGKERSSHVFGTEVLHEAEVPIVKTSACREVYEDYFITENMFCAGYRKGRIDSCAGDSGGPLLCPVGDRWTIFGITSFGEGCGKRGKYGIYTKVPNYVSWIQRVIDLNGGIQ